ncbi:unnamed protein product, partial [marine sediment metagenome]
ENSTFNWSTEIKKICASEGCGNAGQVKLTVAGVDYEILGPPSSANIYTAYNTTVNASWDSSTSFTIQAFRDSRNLAGGETDTRNNIFNLSVISNYTHTFTSTANSTTIWNIYSCTTDNNCEYATSNYTIHLDTSIPQIDVENPVGTLDYNYIGGSETLNVTF